MNIFILDKDVYRSARFHCDKHIVKMPLETAQMLCTALREVVGEDASFERQYKSTHKHHPCVKWASESYENYEYLCRLGVALCKEYTHRYSKYHKCWSVIVSCSLNSYKFQNRFPKQKRTKFAQAMPEEYKQVDSVKAYRMYYLNEKQHLFAWKNRETPKFILDSQIKKTN